ncbi:MAG TPA: hypothetical protein VGI32_05400 [Steroidobacteraceae bacterium]|jgi:hypothetical protein
MNRTVYRLLKGYMIRSVWLYMLLGLAQFSLTGVYWLHGFGRMSVIGLALAVWGAATALNANSLVWRSLPIAAKDASVFRWWAMAGVPGIYMTLVAGLTWASNRAGGYWTPAPDAIFEGIFAIWAALGVVAVLLRSPAFYAARARSAKIIATVIFATVLLCYGVPVGSAARPYSIGLFVLGVVLLVISAGRAHNVRHWRWPDTASPSSPPSRQGMAIPAAFRYGIWTVLLPLLQRTAVIALIAAVLVAALHVYFPRAGATLFWVYFMGLSSAGFLLTVQIRSALQPLRCLPLSARQLAALLLVFGSLPGVATLGVAFLLNRAVLNADLNFSAVATIALIIIATQALPLGAAKARVPAGHLGGWVRWVPLAMRIFWPFYIGVMSIGLMAGNSSGAFAKWWWFRCGLTAVGVGLCICGYFILVYQLRAGVRPSGNENLFSAG